VIGLGQWAAVFLPAGSDAAVRRLLRAVLHDAGAAAPGAGALDGFRLPPLRARIPRHGGAALRGRALEPGRAPRVQELRRALEALQRARHAGAAAHVRLLQPASLLVQAQLQRSGTDRRAAFGSGAARRAAATDRVRARWADGELAGLAGGARRARGDGD